MDIVIGDPKTSIVAGNKASVAPLEQSSIAVGPNPCSGSLIIHPNGGEIQSLRMINELGQVVFASNETLAQTTTMDFSHLTTGVYYLEIQSGAGVQRTKIIFTR